MTRPLEAADEFKHCDFEVGNRSEHSIKSFFETSCAVSGAGSLSVARTLVEEWKT